MSVLVRFDRFYTPFINYIEITESGYYKGLKDTTFLIRPSCKFVLRKLIIRKVN